MGMRVTTDMTVFKDKALVAYNFNPGNENIVYLMDAKGNETRVRIPSYMVDVFLDFVAIETCQEKAA